MSTQIQALYKKDDTILLARSIKVHTQPEAPPSDFFHSLSTALKNAQSEINSSLTNHIETQKQASNQAQTSDPKNIPQPDSDLNSDLISDLELPLDPRLAKKQKSSEQIDS